jgi:hypothetical protein
MIFGVADPSPPEIEERIRQRLDAGAAKAAILAMLRGMGITGERATALYEGVRRDHQRRMLPSQLRKSARRDLVLGCVGLLFSGAIGAFMLPTMLAQADDRARGIGKIIVFMVAIALLSTRPQKMLPTFRRPAEPMLVGSIGLCEADRDRSVTDFCGRVLSIGTIAAAPARLSTARKLERELTR